MHYSCRLSPYPIIVPFTVSEYGNHLTVPILIFTSCLTHDSTMTTVTKIINAPQASTLHPFVLFPSYNFILLRIPIQVWSTHSLIYTEGNSTRQKGESLLTHPQPMTSGTVKNNEILKRNSKK